jgi:hypothetical protein
MMTPTRRPRSFAHLARCCQRTLLAFALAAFGAIALPAAAQTPAPTPPALTEAVEFYNASLDHYFITADSVEIGLLDEGAKIKGWARTGKSFKVWPATPTVSGATPVCRFYGNPARGLDSHFYSASPTECAEVKSKFPDSWLLEADIVFQVTPVSLPAGTCPSGTKAVQRTYNNRGDVNHRYTTDPAVQTAMVQKGYVEEGYGSPPVVMCAPEPVTAVPVCQVSASAVNPPAGTAVTLTASCDPAATSYAWSGCNTTGPTCTYTSPTATTINFAVSGVNANGTGPQVSLPITWTGGTTPPPPSGPVPVCTLSADIAAPKTGDLVTITATCSNSPTQFIWSGACNPNGDKCVAQSNNAGTKSYAVEGVNANGRGNAATLSLTWTVGLPTAAPVCTTLSASNMSPIIGTNVTLTAICSNLPTGYTWTGCTSTGSTCTDNVATAGSKTYTVTATNAIGTSTPPLSIALAWRTPPPAPTCTLTSSASNPPAGTTITLTANCSNFATSFAWSANTGCGTGTQATCTTSSATQGLRTYTVAGTNTTGTGTPASLDVTWAPPPVPVCSISANTSTPTVSGNVVLTANCTGAPTSWAWSANTNCGSTQSCVTSSATQGAVTYTMTATNVTGTSTPATKDVTWLPPSADLCEPFYTAGVITTTMPWRGTQLLSRDEGGFAAEGVWRIRFTVPATAVAGTSGSSNFTEYIDPSAQRTMTLSRQACDFRPVDPTGISGPLKVAYGTTATVNWTIGTQAQQLEPGQTYYINIRNRDPYSGVTGCSNFSGPLPYCNGLINFQWP